MEQDHLLDHLYSEEVFEDLLERRESIERTTDTDTDDTNQSGRLS